MNASILSSVRSLALAGIFVLSGQGGIARDVNVREFGAKGDGRTDETAAIRRAIEAAVGDGGGTVSFPAGEYLSYSLQLRSHLTLHLGAGATLVAAEPSADLSVGYDAPEANAGVNQYQDFGHSHWRNSLIWGEGLTDVTIIGPGTIFGRGLSRGDRGRRRDFLPEERAGEKRPDLALPAGEAARLAAIKPGPFGHPGKDSLPAGVGNKAIALKNCRNVTFRDFTIYHGGHFAILATGVDNWTMDNLRIDTNRDGVDIDACQNVRMSNCTVNAPYDDAICLKSSYGIGHARMTENITITNCLVSGYDEGTLIDGAHRCSRVGFSSGGISDDDLAQLPDFRPPDDSLVIVGREYFADGRGVEGDRGRRRGANDGQAQKKRDGDEEGRQEGECRSACLREENGSLTTGFVGVSAGARTSPELTWRISK